MATTGTRHRKKVVGGAAKTRRGGRRHHAAGRTGDGATRRVEGALKRFEAACGVAVAKGRTVVSLGHAIADAAVAKQSAAMLRELCEQQLLRDVLTLRDAFAECAPGSLNPRLEALRLLPTALIQWFEGRFQIVPVGVVGEVMEVAAASLRRYTCNFDVPEDGGRLLRVRVVASGWQRGKTVLIPPTVRLAE